MEALLYFVFVCGLLTVAAIDWSHMIIPRAIIVVLLPVAVLIAVVSADITFIASLGGLLLGGGLLAVVYLVYRAVRKREGLGAGDLFLAAILGIVTGWSMPLLLALSSVSALAYAAYLVYGKGRDRHVPVPYGSFLAAWGIVFCYVRIYS